MNLCRSCGEDFGSLSGFDAHRIGTHTYTFAEGMRRTPSVEDGRRCLDEEELLALGWRRDRFGRWRQPIDENAVLRLRQIRRAPASTKVT